jgi:NTP pyrophosphatase (non-canonical NTP hydrolase)
MDTFCKIRQWAHDRNLVRGATPASQFEKLLEETTELYSGLRKDNVEEIKDAIGDCAVVLTIMAAQLDMSFEDCVDHAYNQIKDRKGKMVDGVFIKETKGN